ncbi:MAG: hypothetical protein O7A65_11130 [Proteobacteria bacterium]|nr:hypothetical protein [Pseudomonadota bacterium]
MNNLPTERFDELVQISDRLSDLMSAETTALRAMRPKDIVPLQEEKALLTEQYAEQLKLLRADPHVLDQTDASTRELVRDATRRLHDLARHNCHVLTAARTVNERLMKAVADAVSAENQPTRGYTAVGEKSTPPPALDTTGNPISLNTKI